MTDEEYVRSVWESVNWGASDYSGKKFGVIVYDDGEGTGFGATSQHGAWAAAAEFTRNRIEQIRQVEEEIATTRVDLGFAKTEHTRRVYSSILAREQAALAELKRGMK